MASDPSFLWYKSEAGRELLKTTLEQSEQNAKPHEFSSKVAELLAETDKLLSLDASEWQFVKKDEGVSVYKRAVPGSALPMTKGEGIIVGFPPSAIVSVAVSFGCRLEWDSMFEQGRLAQVVDDRTNIGWAAMKGQWVVSSRDLCGLSTTKVFPNGKIVYGACSVVSDQVPIDRNRVRMDVDIAVWIFEPIEDESGQIATKTTYLSKVDLKGWIPESILTMVAESTPLCVKKINRFITTYGPPPIQVRLAGSLIEAPLFQNSSSELVVNFKLRNPPNQFADFTEFFFSSTRYPNGITVTATPPNAFSARVFQSNSYGFKGLHIRLYSKGAELAGTVAKIVMRPASGQSVSATFNNNKVTIEPFEAPEEIKAIIKEVAVEPSTVAADHSLNEPVIQKQQQEKKEDVKEEVEQPEEDDAGEDIFTIVNVNVNTGGHRYASTYESLCDLADKMIEDWKTGPPKSGWEDLGTTPTLTTMRKNIEGHAMGILAGSVEVEGFSLIELVAALREDGARKIWDAELYDGSEFRETLGYNVLLVRTRLKGKFPTAPRDCSLISCTKPNPDGSIYVMAASVKDDKNPEVKGYVRAQLDIALWYLQPIPSTNNRVRIVYISKTDPQGWIPGALLKLASREVPSCALHFKRFLAEFGPPPQLLRLAGNLIELELFDNMTSQYSIKYESKKTNEFPTTRIGFHEKRYRGMDIDVTVTPSKNIQVTQIHPNVIDIRDTSEGGVGLIEVRTMPSKKPGLGFIVNGLPINSNSAVVERKLLRSVSERAAPSSSSSSSSKPIAPLVSAIPVETGSVPSVGVKDDSNNNVNLNDESNHVVEEEADDEPSNSTTLSSMTIEEQIGYTSRRVQQLQKCFNAIENTIELGVKSNSSRPLFAEPITWVSAAVAVTFAFILLQS